MNGADQQAIKNSSHRPNIRPHFPILEIATRSPHFIILSHIHAAVNGLKSLTFFPGLLVLRYAGTFSWRVSSGATLERWYAQ